MGSYTSVDRVYDVEPMIGSIDDLTSSQVLTAFIEAAEAEINARIATHYVVPITGSVPLLVAIADDLSIYRILTRRIFTQTQLENSTWPDRFKESMDTLALIAKGEIKLVDSAGTLIGARTDVAQVRTNNMNYQPTFHEGGDWVDQVKDHDKTDDLLDDRDLGVR